MKKFEHIGGPCRRGLDSEVQLEQVWTFLRRGSLYDEVKCIMGNGHMAPSPSPSRQPDTTENITFATPLVGGNKVAGEL